MSRENLRLVEIVEKHEIRSLPQSGEYVIGLDEEYNQGYFHRWDCNGDLKGIIELQDGTIKLIPYENIKFLDIKNQE